MFKNILATVVACITLFLGTSAWGQSASIDGKWKKDVGSDIWQTEVTVKGVAYKVHTFLLEDKKITLFVHENCPGRDVKKVTIWAAGDLYASVRTCEGKSEHSLDFHILIERELKTGIPRPLQERLREFHNNKTKVFTTESAPRVRFFLFLQNLPTVYYICMKYAYLLFFCILFSPLSFTHAEEINAGFVQGLWYSSDQILEGVPLRVYAALRNNTPHDLIGTVRFMDNGKRIGSAPVSALSGRLVETWTDWTPTAGEHSLSVSLGDAELHVIGGEIIQADVANIVVNDILTADIDTDKDGVGNMADTDDDGDDISDEEEMKQGSNPLIANKKKVEEVVEKPIETVPQPAVPVQSEEGLEKFVGDGTVSNLLSNVTDKVEDAKQSLDAYREKRNEEIYNSKLPTSTETTAGALTDNATITRSKIETNDSFLSALVSGVRAILQNIWTLVLWLLSKVLTHPALIQFALLVGILYMFYRTARRFGRRNYN